MIELPEGLVIISDEHCYIVGNPRKSRGKGVEIKNPKYYAHIDPRRACPHSALESEKQRNYYLAAVP